MVEHRHGRTRTPEQAGAAPSLPAAERRAAAEAAWDPSQPALRAVRNHLLAVMAATR
ncbi:hypothetical protein [Catellatospora citrea]|uniref:Uncharacterized protein n=1 Tax=Catellatospora citrea TaxID=53366 RepID=A0A8J3NWT0_9ACTN|nr:hypothetical protein [Catellatospora citrea]RKE06993.1 hypothetical protein C8E86_1817 [Catellatospora citrea]GIF95143.1 hypothetical protein Cci01nite_02370 [Catellatospora citrea]